jgi:hypothetical protein
LDTGILVYIPCHKDFWQAVNQAKTLRRDFENYSKLENSHFKSLYIVISVNAFEPTDEQKLIAASLCDEVYYHGLAFLSDVNIAQGFLVALRMNPEIFWLLSANDKLRENALIRILQVFEKDEKLDLVVIDPAVPPGTMMVSDLQYINGLISGVVYRLLNTRNFFNSAPFFPWTGWSQLSVLKAAIQGNSFLRITSIQESILSQEKQEFFENSSRYVHSFNGWLIQNFLYQGTDKARRKFIRSFVRKNFFQFHLYSIRDAQKHDVTILVSPDHYLSWNSTIAKSLIKAYTPMTYLVYLVLKRIPFEKFRGVSTLKNIQNSL